MQQARKYSKPVWKMIAEAIEAQGASKPADVVQYIYEHYPGDNVNPNTIRAQMVASSINHPDAHYYSGEHTRLFRLDDGSYKLYDPSSDGDFPDPKPHRER